MLMPVSAKGAGPFKLSALRSLAERFVRGGEILWLGEKGREVAVAEELSEGWKFKEVDEEMTGEA